MSDVPRDDPYRDDALPPGTFDVPPAEEVLTYDATAENSVGRGPIVFLGVIGLLAIFAAVVFFAYQQGLREGMRVAPPLIKAEQQPAKVEPETPGGIEIPHQDKRIYDRIDGEEGQTETVERLLPPVEEPMDLPPPPPSAVEQPQPQPQPARESVEPVDQSASEQTAQMERLIEATAPTPEEAAPVAVIEEELPTTAVAPQPEEGALVLERPEEQRPKPRVVAAPAQMLSPEARTAAIEAAPGEVAPASAVNTATGRFVLQLAAFRDEGTARAKFGQYQSRHASLLGDLRADIQRADLGDRGVFYRLRAGGFDDKQVAQARCNDLKAAGLDCLVRER